MLCVIWYKNVKQITLNVIISLTTNFTFDPQFSNAKSAILSFPSHYSMTDSMLVSYDLMELLVHPSCLLHMWLLTKSWNLKKNFLFAAILCSSNSYKVLAACMVFCYPFLPLATDWAENMKICSDVRCDNRLYFFYEGHICDMIKYNISWLGISVFNCPWYLCMKIWHLNTPVWGKGETVID